MVGYGAIYTFGGDFVKIKHLKKENGQAMVEFALILPILIIVVGGIIDFGWIFHNQLQANNASRELARYFAIHYEYESMTLASAQVRADNIKDGYIAATITNRSATVSVDGTEDRVTIAVNGNVQILTPILGIIIDSDKDGKFPITANSTMRIEK